MKPARIHTRPPILRRIARNEIGFVILLLLAGLLLGCTVEGLCYLAGAGYDPRIGAP